jgi:hypothetical protein
MLTEIFFFQQIFANNVSLIKKLKFVYSVSSTSMKLCTLKKIIYSTEFLDTLQIYTMKILLNK